MNKAKLDDWLSEIAESSVKSMERWPCIIMTSDRVSNSELEKIGLYGVRINKSGTVHTGDLTIDQIDKLSGLKNVIRIERSRKLRYHSKI